MLFRSYWKSSPADDWYVIGLNYPGLAHSGWGGYQLGPNQIMEHDVNQVTDQTRQELEADFRRIREMGCRVVRMWAFYKGQGLEWVRDGYDDGPLWRVTGINENFRNNVRDITALAACQGIKIYWTLFNGGDFIVDTDHRTARQMKKSFRRVLDDYPRGPYRQSLMDLALPAFLGAIEQHSDGIFAIDLMNEPDVHWDESLRGDLQHLYGIEPGSNLGERALLGLILSRLENVPPIDQYLSFFRQCSDLIHEYFDYSDTGVPVSVGFARFHSIRSNIQELDQFLDFFDYHHYNQIDVRDTGFLPLPQWNDVNDHKPCIIGECGLGGQLREGGIPFSEAFRTPLLEEGGNRVLAMFRAFRSSSVDPVTLQELFDAQANCILNVMQGSFLNGYAGCLVWEYGKQYTNVDRRTSPYRPRGLQDRADWGDQHFTIWTPNESLHINQEYAVTLLQDSTHQRRIRGRKVVRVMNNIYQDHLDHYRCPPVSYGAPTRR